MAARTSAPVGLIVVTCITSLLALVFFVLAIVWFSGKQTALEDLETAQAEVNELAQNPALAQELKSVAGNQGVVDYLDEALEEAIATVTGRPSDTIDAFRSTVDEIRGEGSRTSLVDLIEDLRADVRQAEQELAARDNAIADLRTSLETRDQQLQTARAELGQTVEELNSTVGNISTQAGQYKQEVDRTIAQANQRVDEVRAQLQDQIEDREAQIREQQNELADLRARVAELQGQGQRDRLNAQPEDTLADARVLTVAPSGREIEINRGNGDRLVLGMTFEVYSSSTAIRPNERGELPQGKATVEITRIREDTARARVIRRTSGQPISPQDVLVNGVWDPNKTYSFVVFGNFDTNRDTIYTRAEAEEIKAIINEWGGEIDEDLDGNTDFIVLGERPTLGPEPRADDPLPVIERFLQQRSQVERYDELLELATARSVPILNENRLYTLTGLRFRN